MKNKIIIIFCVFTLYLFLGVLVNKHPTEGMAIGAISFFTLSYLLNKKYKDVRVTNIIIISVIIITILIISVGVLISGLNKLQLAGNIYIIYFIISIYFGHVVANKNNKLSAISLLLSFIILTIPVSLFIPVFISQHNFFKTFTGRVSYNIPEESNMFLNNKSDTLQFKDLNKEIVVLDYWNNGCGVCFQKFPKLAQLAEEHQENSKVGFYAINSFTKIEDIKKGYNLFAKQKLNIPTYFQHKDLAKKLNIEAYPTVLVIKNDKVIFRGSIETLTTLDFIYLR